MEMIKAKQLLREILGDNIKINKTFDERFSNLKESMQEEFINWCIECKEGRALGSVPPKKGYRDLYVFFRKIGNNVRAVIIKKQNNGFIEVILENHDTYDEKRQELGYKKSSYYAS